MIIILFLTEPKLNAVTVLVEFTWLYFDIFSYYFTTIQVDFTLIP